MNITNDDIAWCKRRVLAFGVYDDIEEMTGDALLALVKAARNYDPGKASFRSYANAYIAGGVREGILKRKGYRKIRDKWEPQHTEHAELTVDPDSGYRLDDEVLAVLQAQRFDELLATLSESMQEIIRYDISGQSQSDLAKRDGVSKSAVSQRLKYAKNKLREAFECNS